MNEKKRRIQALLAALALSACAAYGVNRATGSSTRTVYAQGEYVEQLSGVSSPFADVAQVVMPCVVGVSNRANTYSIVSGQTELVEQATGSGVVITTQGHVVTNHHVVEGANDVQVLWQGQYLQAEIIGVDELTDLAVLRVTEDVTLPAVRMGQADEVRVGDWAIVIGNPLGSQLADTVTVGVVSAVDREIDSSTIVKMLQTDAAINSGNSGGGMFNTRGELIGIPSLKFSASGSRSEASIEGIAMAIPMDVVQPVVESLIQYGKVTRPKLGISVLTLRGSEEPTDGMIPAGVYVSTVSEGSPAQKAGIRADDIILNVDGRRVLRHTDLTGLIAGKRAGETVTLTICRIPGLSELTVRDAVPRGEIIETTVTLEVPEEKEAS
ncbi:MAG: trypsin-like peptidase domain-containing protein [Clostridiales bacterium]|nr:trypsin-like peptidase domain-containing protein [Clostridiales bacterium]MDY5513871.1 trypsin-like peptidase domain-containing protein [Candidatus Ventricola sp.]